MTTRIIPQSTRQVAVVAFTLSVLFLLFTTSALAAPCALNPASPSVTICTPANGATVSSPVSVVAGTTDNAHPVTAMIVYLDNQNMYKVNANQVSTTLTLTKGQHNITVNAWDSSGTVFKSTVIVTATGSGTAPVSVAVSPSVGDACTERDATIHVHGPQYHQHNRHLER